MKDRNKLEIMNCGEGQYGAKSGGAQQLIQGTHAGWWDPF